MLQGAELAGVTGVPIGTVISRRARGRLRVIKIIDQMRR
jgi:DNA-directed RNA polymerase specialized sigma24 family protein